MSGRDSLPLHLSPDTIVPQRLTTKRQDDIISPDSLR